MRTSASTKRISLCKQSSKVSCCHAAQIGIKTGLSLKRKAADMSYQIIILAIVLIATMLITSIISNIRAKRRRIASIKAAYGKPPVTDDFIQLESISRYARHIETHSPCAKRVDAITWNDLDMDKVFNRINICQTSVGEEYLYNCLHELPLNNQALAKREGLIQFFADNADARLAVQELFASRMGKENYNGLVSLMFAPSTSLLKYRHLYTALAILPLVMLPIMLINILAGIICFVAALAVNMVVYYRTEKHIAVEIPTIKYLACLLRCCKDLSKMKALESQPIMHDISRHYKSLKSVKRNIPNMASSLKGEIVEMFFEYMNIMFLYDIRNFNKLMKAIKERSEEFHALYRTFGEVDMSICIASFRQSLPEYSQPEFGTGSEVEFTDIYHPLIPVPVTNSGTVSNNSLITGSNASGKSTFIKALAINGILAQTINTCAAKAYKARFSLVVTSMVMRDDLIGGESYFIVEIKSLKRILDLVEKYPCTCFVDEILRGTNTAERIAASAAVLEHLNAKDTLCVAATHDIELTRILAGKYDNYHFREQVTDDGIVFDYKLLDGPATTRNAIKLLRFMAFDAVIVERAEVLAEGVGGAGG